LPRILNCQGHCPIDVCSAKSSPCSNIFWHFLSSQQSFIPSPWMDQEASTGFSAIPCAGCHDLGGGATLQAGFVRVKDPNKLSVGVAMAF